MPQKFLQHQFAISLLFDFWFACHKASVLSVLIAVARA